LTGSARRVALPGPETDAAYRHCAGRVCRPVNRHRRHRVAASSGVRDRKSRRLPNHAQTELARRRQLPDEPEPQGHSTRPHGADAERGMPCQRESPCCGGGFSTQPREDATTIARLRDRVHARTQETPTLACLAHDPDPERGRPIEPVDVQRPRTPLQPQGPAVRALTRSRSAFRARPGQAAPRLRNATVAETGGRRRRRERCVCGAGPCRRGDWISACLPGHGPRSVRPGAGLPGKFRAACGGHP
jgi:hypothetical protein